MTVYTYSKVLVWDNAGGSVRVARNQAVTVTDPATGLTVPGLTQNGQPVSTVTSDGDGHANFASTLGVVRITTPKGSWQDVESPDLRTNALQAVIDASSAASSAAAAQSAAAQSATDAQTAKNAAVTAAGNVTGAILLDTDGVPYFV